MYLCLLIAGGQILRVSACTYVTFNDISHKATHINGQDGSDWLTPVQVLYHTLPRANHFLLVDLPKLRAPDAAHTKQCFPLKEPNLGPEFETDSVTGA